MNRIFPTRIRSNGLALLAASGSAGLLIGALIFEHGYGMAPCTLCHWQ